MLFHITHIHTPELCPSDSPEKVKETVGVVESEEHAKKTGVKVLGRYIAPTEHRLFFTVEASAVQRLLFQPTRSTKILRCNLLKR